MATPSLIRKAVRSRDINPEPSRVAESPANATAVKIAGRQSTCTLLSRHTQLRPYEPTRHPNDRHSRALFAFRTDNIIVHSLGRRPFRIKHQAQRSIFHRIRYEVAWGTGSPGWGTWIAKADGFAVCSHNQYVSLNSCSGIFPSSDSHPWPDEARASFHCQGRPGEAARFRMFDHGHNNGGSGKI